MFGQNREQLRRFYLDCWSKAQSGTHMAGLEKLVAEVIAQHPEYHPLLADPDSLQRDFSDGQGQTNPFLHMGMHIALAEQLSADRPAGIRALQHRLVLHSGDAHAAEHRMMECLGQVLQEAQQTGQPPDEQGFLACLRRLATGLKPA